jgi:cytochrome c
MLVGVSIGCLVVAWPIGLSEAQARATQAGPGFVSVWSGVYSLAQAERGEKIYKAECGRCHSPDIRLSRPAFVGTRFFDRWRNRSVGDIFMYIKVNMPQDAPDSLTNREYVDIVAHLLHENRFPTGESELPAEFDALSNITVTGRPDPEPRASR